MITIKQTNIFDEIELLRLTFRSEICSGFGLKVYCNVFTIVLSKDFRYYCFYTRNNYTIQ
jgi:hypothetical protein